MAFAKKRRYGKKELITITPFVILFGVVLAILAPYAQGFLFGAAVVLGIILCYFAMTMISCLYRGYFTSSVALRAALAGGILFVSDLVVAFSIFHPDFQDFLLWKENLIWGTYMVGWILIMTILNQEHPTLK